MEFSHLLIQSFRFKRNAYFGFILAGEGMGISTIPFAFIFIGLLNVTEWLTTNLTAE
ncbi:hypothetical protein XBJ2_1540001 [Xenorhabdus bovienii str. Jollieti]|nr:hypothetical protein XBJ2_1540001 [Xenorhabdus bovienii str. Jollieti]